jgi:deazaflavin-dependent oxidoreductase (nitroreductase family)
MSLGIKLLMAGNTFVYRLTGGALGSRMGGQSVLLLHSVGRKSGKQYTTPVNFYRDGENYILVASNWGGASHPSWYFNLKQQPDTTIQVGRQELPVKASQASGADYERLWQYVTRQNPFYTRYQSQTTRRIPIVILTPRK